MTGLEKDVQAAARATRSWRAQYLCDAADQIDRQIERLKAQAAEYRELASRLKGTEGHG